MKQKSSEIAQGGAGKPLDANEKQNGPELYEFFKQDHSLRLQTLFDLIAHEIPDKVLGDGGSLFLKIRLPNEELLTIKEKKELTSPCRGCKIDDPTKNSCTERAFLIASTREEAKSKIGRKFYCTNKKIYVTVGEKLKKYHDRNLKQIKVSIKKVIESFIEKEIKNNPSPYKDKNNIEWQDAIDTVKNCFKGLFCPVEKTVKGQTYSKSAISETINEIVSTKIDIQRTISFDKAAESFFKKYFKSPEKNGNSKKNSADEENDDARVPNDSFKTILRNLMGLFRSSESDFAMKSIVWEIFQFHDSLQRAYKNYVSFLDRLRDEYPHLGLSGWSCATGFPVCLRRIENPFEVCEFPEWLKEYNKKSKSAELPIPLWGDRVRGHRDRIENEGRPFLGVPILNPDDPSQAIGIIRVATKREGERYFFTDKSAEDVKNGMDNISILEKFTKKIFRIIKELEIPLAGDDVKEESPDKNSLQFFSLLKLYGAIKGEDLAELGNIIADLLRRMFQAVAASLFLKEDFWLSGELKQSGDKTNSKKNPEGEKKKDADQYGSKRFYLWGTSIKESESTNKVAVEDYINSVRSDRFYYRSGEGKTGWAIKQRAAIMVKYGEKGERCTIWLSKNQIIQAVNEKDTWTWTLPESALAHDPKLISKLINEYAKVKSAKDRIEIETQKHEGFLVAPLIDPDISPEPIGAIRFVFSRKKNGESQRTENENKLLLELLENVCQISRECVRLLRTRFANRKNIRTFTELIQGALESYPSDNPDEDASGKTNEESRDQGVADAPESHQSKKDSSQNDSGNESNKKSPGEEDDVLSCGPYGKTAASLLGLSEATVVSILVHNDLAPSQYRQLQPSEETWVLVGSAASRDGLSKEEKSHFTIKFCSKYFQKKIGGCRYRSGEGLTGAVIESKEARIIDWAPEIELRRSTNTCEIQDFVSMMIIPAVESEYSKENKNVSVVVRFLRAKEGRRSSFKNEERTLLTKLVDSMKFLVRAWSQRNLYEESLKEWRREVNRNFPEDLLKFLKDEFSKQRKKNDEKTGSSNNRTNPDDDVKYFSFLVPDWAFDKKSKNIPKELSKDEVRLYELSILAWFYRQLELKHGMTLNELVKKVIRALLMVHWGPEKAGRMLECIDRLDRFEPVLSMLPRYRDHSVHQFHVFLIGWILFHRLENANIIKLEYCGWKAAKKPVKPAEDQNSRPDNHVCMNSWVIASLFHDIAYPLEHLSKWSNLFGNILIFGKTSQDYQFVNPTKDHGIFDNNQHLYVYKKIIVEHLQSMFEQDAQSTNMRNLQDIVTSAISNWDHGIWASFVLLNSMMNVDEVIDSSVAIAIHSSIYQSIGRLGLKLNLNSSSTAIAAMLLLCDTIHEWERDIWDIDDSNSEERRMLLRPSLLCINEVEHNKTTEADVKLKDITFDLALGSKTSTELVLKKKDEIQFIADMVVSNKAIIWIRISQEDPKWLSPRIIENYQVKVDP